MNDGMVSSLESQVAARMNPLRPTFRFGNRIGGWSGLTLPGSMQNIRGFRKAKPEKPDKVRNLIGRPGPRNGGSYW